MDGNGLDFPGQGGLDREINSVTVQEIINEDLISVKFLTAGVFIVSSLYAIAEDTDTQVSLIRRQIGKKAAALAEDFLQQRIALPAPGAVYALLVVVEKGQRGPNHVPQHSQQGGVVLFLLIIETSEYPLTGLMNFYIKQTCQALCIILLNSERQDCSPA